MSSLFEQAFRTAKDTKAIAEFVAAPAVLALLGLTANNVPRYRHAFLDASGQIVIYTRSCGVNRATGDNAGLEALPTFVSTADDPSGPACHGSFLFTIPAGQEKAAEALPRAEKLPAERWATLAGEMKGSSDDLAKPVKDILALQLAEKIAAADPILKAQK